MIDKHLSKSGRPPEVISIPFLAAGTVEKIKPRYMDTEINRTMVRKWNPLTKQYSHRVPQGSILELFHLYLACVF